MPRFRELLVELRQPIRFRRGEPALVDETPLTKRFGDIVRRGRVFPSFPALGARLEDEDAEADTQGVLKDPRAERRRIRRRRLRSFARVRFRPGVDLHRKIAQLVRHPDVLSVSVAGIAVPACPTDLTGNQIVEPHLDVGPSGVGAEAFWNLTDFGASGTPRVRVCVCDEAYFEHPNTPDVQFLDGPVLTAPLDVNDVSQKTLTHGTSALGLVGADPTELPNQDGVTGVAWGAALYFSSTAVLDLGDTAVGDEALVNGPTRAVDRALGTLDGVDGATLQAGDVLLIEWQLQPPSSYVLADKSPVPGFLPAEVDPQVRLVLEEAVENGVIVIQPAGNGNASLERVYEDVDGTTTLRWDPDDDSGAVMVGSGVLSGAGVRMRYTYGGQGGNYGPRLDCHASGSGVGTTAVSVEENPAPPWDRVATATYANFGQTSAASAIVAGAAACIQWLHHQRLATKALPREVRAVLRENENGTVQTLDSALNENALVHRVGPQPDLSLIASRVPASSVVHLRDSLADLGAAIPKGALLQARCADIVVTRVGEASALNELNTWDVEFPPLAIVDAQTEVRLRARNRGTSAVPGTASLYWSAPAAFLHPKWWSGNHVADLAFTSIPAGGVGVADAVANWADPPPDGGFLSWVVEFNPDGADPAFPNAESSTDEYLDFAQKEPFLRALSLQKVGIKSGDVARFHFHLRGIPEAASNQTLLIGSELPDGSKVKITPDANLVNAADGSVVTDAGVELVLASEDWRGAGAALTFELDADQEIAMTIDVALATGSGELLYTTTIDQFMDDAHLGRMHLLLDVEKPVIV